MENWPMIRIVVVVGTLLFGAGAVMAQQEVAVKQDNLMRAQGKSMYGIILKMTKGEIPYDQKAADDAVAALAESVPTIPSVFATNPKEDVVNATYGSSQKIWQNKADFEARAAKLASDAKAAAAAADGGAASFKTAFAAVGSNCQGCHQEYRLKE